MKALNLAIPVWRQSSDAVADPVMRSKPDCLLVAESQAEPEPRSF